MCTMFINNNRPSFQLWSKKNLVKHQKVSKSYETDCRYHRFCLCSVYLFCLHKFKVLMKKKCYKIGLAVHSLLTSHILYLFSFFIYLMAKTQRNFYYLEHYSQKKCGNFLGIFSFNFFNRLELPSMQVPDQSQ